MEGLLTPVSTSYKVTPQLLEDDLVENGRPSILESKPVLEASTPEETLRILQSEPSFQDLQTALRFLIQKVPSEAGFNIASPSPITAQLINALVTDVTPAYWKLFQDKEHGSRQRRFKHGLERSMLLKCLRNVTGLNAIVTRMKSMLQQTNDYSHDTTTLQSVEILVDLYELLGAVLDGSDVVEQLWSNVQRESPQKQRALWQETINLIASGRLLNIAAETFHTIVRSEKQTDEIKFITDGTSYSLWLVQNIREWTTHLSVGETEAWKGVTALLSKGLRLGYQATILNHTLELLLGTDDDQLHFEHLLSNLSSREQRTFVIGGLQFLSQRYNFSDIEHDDFERWNTDANLVSAAAGFLKVLISDQDGRRETLITWLTSLSGAGIGGSVGIRRAAIAVISSSKNDVETVLEDGLRQFGDLLYIKHTPILQQEVHTQVILLAAGYLHRIAPLKLSILLRSSVYLNAVSHRLAASSDRARYLGMIVGEGLSALTNGEDKKMSFKMEELESPEATWYKNLVNVSDSVGGLKMLQTANSSMTQSKRRSQAKPHSKNHVGEGGYSKVLVIEEINDDGNNEVGDDLIPYAKPDSDPEDSDDDPTLIQRNKPTAPVYIRDLIIYLRDTDTYDRQKLALATAPQLIRRKANFGTEVAEHTEELATLLVGLQDKFDIDNFQDMRLQGMIAVLVSQPARMGKWFARTFFEGDYSVSQRASILTVLSVGARELGGYKDEDSSLTTITSGNQDQFPSKRLPSRLRALYAQTRPEEKDNIDALSTQLSKTMIEPLAASVADGATGPNILKVRTFSSRLEVESRRKPAKANTLSAIAADSFFFPLTGRFFVHLRAFGTKNVMFESFLLSSFLKTLVLILHASGPSTLQLPQMTNEMWDLLLTLRGQAQEERNVGQAVLFGFMTILEVNQDTRRLAETHGRELLETQRWVELLFQMVGEGSKEEDQIRALAAGVLYKIKEVVDKYQALLVGDLSTI